MGALNTHQNPATFSRDPLNSSSWTPSMKAPVTRHLWWFATQKSKHIPYNFQFNFHNNELSSSTCCEKLFCALTYLNCTNQIWLEPSCQKSENKNTSLVLKEWVFFKKNPFLLLDIHNNKKHTWNLLPDLKIKATSPCTLFHWIKCYWHTPDWLKKSFPDNFFQKGSFLAQHG